MSSPRLPLLPGSLVRPKFNMKVTLWSSYTTRVCQDGITRATMKRSLGTNLDSYALVISVPLVPVRNNNGTGVVALYVPALARFCYTWDSYLKVLA